MITLELTPEEAALIRATLTNDYITDLVAEECDARDVPTGHLICTNCLGVDQHDAACGVAAMERIVAKINTLLPED